MSFIVSFIVSFIAYLHPLLRTYTTKHYLRLVPGHLREDYDRAMPEIEVGLDVHCPPNGLG